MALNLITAGESHGPGLTCIIEGLPAGLQLDRESINRDLARSQPLRRLLQLEPSGGMRLLTSTGGIVQPRAVACVEQLIVDEVQAGRYDPPADPGTLAYAVVRLAEAFLYNDASSDIRGDYRRLRDVQAALLGVPRVTSS